ncbi:hypothetical protein [Anaerotignum propionicum]|uniref:hypothetical protein n=1 Tax=Anaerotignum propionicum TaxID=28446 RepID=UPI0021090175|nr:hypothetical protein [Anaerotignum propionicum]MCQ4937323.1 hypothetical protein [Anaerotignum propionicum]
MKKRLLFFALIVAFLLPSCSDIMKNQTGMIIQPTRFSNETQKDIRRWKMGEWWKRV